MTGVDGICSRCIDEGNSLASQRAVIIDFYPFHEAGFFFLRSIVRECCQRNRKALAKLCLYGRKTVQERMQEGSIALADIVVMQAACGLLLRGCPTVAV